MFFNGCFIRLFCRGNIAGTSSELTRRQSRRVISKRGRLEGGRWLEQQAAGGRRLEGQAARGGPGREEAGGRRGIAREAAEGSWLEGGI